MKSEKVKTFLKFYIVSVVLFVLFVQIPFIRSFLNRADLFFNDIHFNIKEFEAKKINDIVIIDIDEKSINKLGRFSSWPLEYYGTAVDYACEGGAKLIAFDIFFTEQDRLNKNIVNLYVDNLKEKFKVDSTTLSEIIQSLDTEKEFANSLKKSNRTVLAAFDDFNIEELKKVDLPDNLTRFKIDSTSYLPKFKEFNSPNFPITSLASASHKLGFAHISPDDDGTTRHYDTFFKYQNNLVVNFSMQLVLDYYGIDSVSFNRTNAILYKNKVVRLQIPIDENGKTPLNYYGKKKQFRYISFSDVVRHRIDPSFFENKIVLIGSSAIGLRDLKTIPIDDNYPGIELHATFVYNAMQNNFITSPSLMVRLFMSIFVISLCLFVFWRFDVIWNIVIFPVIAALILVAVHVLFETSNMLIDQSYLILFEILSFMSILVFKYQTEFKEKQKIKKTFAKYVSSSIINEMLEHPEKLTLGGEVKTVTALFSDIQNFTNISEKISPAELTDFLKKYMTALTQIVYDKGGMLDKYIGDAIVALFGVPVVLEDHAVFACECVLAMKKKSQEIIDAFPNPNLRGIKTRFGLNTGSMICGNMGSEQLFDYTGIGDNMNLASRLESINKIYGTDIVIAESTRLFLDDSFILRELDRVAVKGKSYGVVIYELIGKKEDLLSGLEQINSKIAKYQSALAFYYAAQWKESEKQFFEYLNIYKDDKAATALYERILRLKENPPTDWDGVCKMESK
ncbi:MAG: adenylate/guanylate cyclase domain-containing protein [bacterium]